MMHIIGITLMNIDMTCIEKVEKNESSVVFFSGSNSWYEMVK